MELTLEQQTIRELSDRIVATQAPIRILDAIKWDETIKRDFFKHKFQKQPKVSKDYYLNHPLSFDPEETIRKFGDIAVEIKNKLGHYSNISRIMVRMCDEYCRAIRMLQARGTPQFSKQAMELYGSPDDSFYFGGPKLSELGSLLADTLHILRQEIITEDDVKQYSAGQAVTILQKRLGKYFDMRDRKIVKLYDNIVADAAAGAERIKINRRVKFSNHDLKYLEVHEGWVHLGTTFNGASQPICTFLAKGTPSSSVTQEGLAVVTEIFAFSSNPSRMLKITNRVNALSLVVQGASFIDIFRFFKDQGLSDDESYNYSMRVFRGSTPTDGPFTKDLAYAKGFILIYNYIRLAVQKGLTSHIPTFFVGKTLIEDIPILTELIEQGIVMPPKYLPQQFRELAALSSWMCFSLYLNRFDLEKLAGQYSQFL